MEKKRERRRRRGEGNERREEHFECLYVHACAV